ncbi:Protein of unknown function [Rubrimonas cliftonensis]|uniref:DUF3616 domain-containing protein n=2 Tax=Rubrimonas cliftonensis TaxID=89524 RepID=A0A1H4FK90_9RHOB|nr:Protein of unknown function [Rubrimonas cliftonensis]
MWTALLSASCALSAAASARLEPIGDVALVGEVAAASDISAAARLGRFLALGADEGVGAERDVTVIQLFERTGADRWRLHRTVPVFQGDKRDGRELDLEAFAVDGDTLYAIGSHGRKRKLTDPDSRRGTNLKRLRFDGIERERSREHVLVLRLGENGALEERDRFSLRGEIANDPVLSGFRATPSKENGVDIEGLAFRDGRLWVGFRGPVLRENFVPVMVFDPEDHDDYELRFVQLGGRGIRSLEAVSDGFLMIAGPVGDGEDGFQLLRWDGVDMLPGAGAELGRVELLGAIASAPGARPEGLAVLAEDAAGYDLMVVFDGADANQVAQRYRASR